MSGQGKTVCVTGGSGYIASWLVKLLLQHDYTVRASVRDPSNPKKTEHLLALDGAKERLHLFKGNLLEEGSFDSVVDGCDGVFHTASPCFFTTSDPQDTEPPQGRATLDPPLQSKSRIIAITCKPQVLVTLRRLVKVEPRMSRFTVHPRTQPLCCAELIDPALKGTLNVLGSCAKSPTVKRVVLTSSMSAVTCTGRPRTPDEITDETWFSDPEFCKENK
ncbi:unnamed protein product [Camellia sinensis]